MKQPNQPQDQQAGAQTAQRYRTFEDLNVYRAARAFRRVMHAVSRRLPEIEKFAFANQIRRAAVSVTNNVAEGLGRYHYLEQIKRGSSSKYGK